jgi:crotonobetainyl-CoA:carnitine CoA-transferase CaiB-like acyl-CoA transferase
VARGTPPDGPLAGVRVLDFSTRLPGPLASLMLCEAGAEVIKVERADTGDEARAHVPSLDGEGAAFALLNRGKRSVCIVLKAEGSLARIESLVATSDVLIEQFRPGVMDRLGLGYERVRTVNPRVVYCSITGYGKGELAARPGHDLDYLARSGLLTLSADRDATPGMPPVPIADIAGGSYPLVVNGLLALRQRERTGEGARIDIAMHDSLLTLMYAALAEGWSTGRWPAPGAARLTGGSPRYGIHRTLDGRFLTCTPLEDAFWERFCDTIGLEKPFRGGAVGDREARERVAAILATRTAADWSERFVAADVPHAIACSLDEAIASAVARRPELFEQRLCRGSVDIAALPLPIDARLRASPRRAAWPRLGEDNDALLARQKNADA